MVKNKQLTFSNVCSTLSVASQLAKIISKGPKFEHATELLCIEIAPCTANVPHFTCYYKNTKTCFENIYNMLKLKA